MAYPTAWPPYDFIALRDIPDSINCGYRTGDGMYAQVVADYGLVLGVDVKVARPDVVERPADNASRAAWLDYVCAQDETFNRADADEMTRADLIALVTKPTPKKATKNDKTTDAESGA